MPESSESSRLIDAAIAPLAPLLRQRGFARRGRTWRRRERDAVQVVNVQASAWNSREAGRFTVNLGVWFPAVAEVLAEKPSRAPGEASCHVRTRIGPLLRAGCDLWWTVSPDLPLLEVEDELTQAVTGSALPWLEAHTDLSSALEFLEERGHPYWHASISAAAMCLLLGRREQARDWLAPVVKGFRRFGNAGAAETWRAWGAQRGVHVE